MNYYEILGVDKNASAKEIAQAKNRLAKLYHPDVTASSGRDSTEQMLLILEAYKVLSDESLRASYDAELTGNLKPMQTFDLSKDEETLRTIDDTMLECWRTADALSRLVSESESISPRKDKAHRLPELAMAAKPLALALSLAGIPDDRIGMDCMNWLLFTWYKNRNYTVAYLLTLYEHYLEKEITHKDKKMLKKKAASYRKQLKRLLKY